MKGRNHETGENAVTKTAMQMEKTDYSGVHEKTDPREIALVKKLDRWIMPMLFSMYFLNYLDRNAIALARLNDLEEDLNLTSVQYETCVSILFVGICVMVVWATVSAITALANGFIGLLLTRFFLGLTESPFYAGAVYIISCFYTRKEIATRIAILYIGNLVATAFAGLIAAGIFHGMDGLANISGWQWLFIIQGIATALFGAIGWFILPNYPQNTGWLSPKERDLGYSRVELDITGNQGETGILKGLFQAVKDPLVWIFAMMSHMHVAATGFKNFFPTVVETLGFNKTVTLVLTCPPYLIAAAGTVIVSWSSGKLNERTWHITLSKLVASTGFIAACATLNTAARYVMMILFCGGSFAINSIIIGWCSSTCGQTKEKRAAAISICTTFMMAAFIWTPYLWPKWDEPRYTIALGSSAGFSMATAVLAWVARSVCVRRNRKLKQEGNETTNFYVY